MAEGDPPDSASEREISNEELVKHYKRCLENWREVLVHTNSLLVWDKPYYPAIIFGYVTFIFVILWYFEPSVLTVVSLIGAVAFILDYAVPALSSSVFDPNKWTGVQERKYEEICQSLVHCKNEIQNVYQYVSFLKQTKAKMYFAIVVTSLLFIAWIGNAVDNLLLMYLFVIFGSFLPGIKHHGIFQEQISSLICIVSQKLKKQ